MTLDALVARLDAYFRVADVRNDDWAPIFDALYPDPYWRDYAEPGYEGRWNGLFVRGDEVEHAATCVFPSDEIVARLPPRTFLFSEHPVDDAPGDLFTPLARETFALTKERGEIRAFRELADEERVAIGDGTHYGLEKPPQLAMVGWFERLGVPAAFEPGRPKRS